MASEAIADSLFSWLDPAGNVHTLDVDVAMTTDDERKVRLTDHVVETGAVVTDHIVLQPEELSFELVMTQTPMLVGNGFAQQNISLEISGNRLASATVPITVAKSRFQPGGFLLLSSGLRSVVANLFGADTPSSMQGSRVEQTKSTVQVGVLQATQPVDRVNDTHDALIEIMNTGLLVTVSFKGRLYLDYLLTKVKLSQGKGEAGMGRFKVDLRAFRAVTGVNVVLPDPADFRALPKVGKGNTPTKTPDPDPTKKVRGKSAAKNVGNAGAAAARAAQALGIGS
jgi:hypothetical protein